MVLMPEPMFGAVEAVDPPRPLFLPSPAAALRPGRGPRAGGRRRLLPAVRSLRGRRRAGARAPGRRRAVDRRLRAGRGRGGGHGGARGGRSAGARRHGQRTSAEEESFTDGLLEYPQYTRPADSGAGRCPRSCGRATTAGSPAGAGPRPWPARWRLGRICIAARGGLTAEELRACWRTDAASTLRCRTSPSDVARSGA